MTMMSRPTRHRLLEPLVRRVWYAAPSGSDGSRVEWILPTGQAQIIISPGSSIFVGPKVLPELIERRTDVPTVGVSLIAGASAAFLGSDGCESRGATVPLDAMVTTGSLADQLLSLIHI